MPDITKEQGSIFDQGTHELAVYPPRPLPLKYLLPFFVNIIIWLCLFLFSLYVFFKILSVQKSMGPSLAIILLLFTMGLLAFSSLTRLVLILSRTFSVLRKLIASKPILLINAQSIYLRNLPIIGDAFFHWHEIASFYLVPVTQSIYGPVNNFCLELKDQGQFLSRFHPALRLFIKLYSVSTGALITQSSRSTNTLIFVSQRFLAVPVEYILMTVGENFQQEIQANSIRMIDRRVERSSV